MEDLYAFKTQQEPVNNNTTMTDDITHIIQSGLARTTWDSLNDLFKTADDLSVSLLAIHITIRLYGHGYPHWDRSTIDLDLSEIDLTIGAIIRYS